MTLAVWRTSIQMSWSPPLIWDLSALLLMITHDGWWGFLWEECRGKLPVSLHWVKRRCHQHDLSLLPLIIWGSRGGHVSPPWTCPPSVSVLDLLEGGHCAESTIKEKDVRLQCFEVRASTQNIWNSSTQEMFLFLMGERLRRQESDLKAILPLSLLFTY